MQIMKLFLYVLSFHRIFYDNALDEIELLQYVSSVLTFSENMDITKVLSCLYYIHKHYSKILDR